MRIRFQVLLAAIAALALPVSADARAKHGKPPSRAVVKKLLVEHYIGDDAVSYPTTKYALQVGSIRRGAPRKGSYWHDGVPPNKVTYVFPLKVTSVYWVCYQDGSVRRDDIVAKYGFFKDELGEWTFRIQDEKRTPPPANHYAGPCPI